MMSIMSRSVCVFFWGCTQNWRQTRQRPESWSDSDIFMGGKMQALFYRQKPCRTGGFLSRYIILYLKDVSMCKMCKIFFPNVGHSVPKILSMCSQKQNCAALFPVPTFMYLWEIYIFPRSVCLVGCRKIGRLILGIYKSLTDTEFGNWDTEHYNSVLEIGRKCMELDIFNWFSSVVHLQCIGLGRCRKIQHQMEIYWTYSAPLHTCINKSLIYKKK